MLGSEEKKQAKGKLKMGNIEKDIEILDDGIIFEGDNDNIQLPLVLIYNSVQGHIFIIVRLWFFKIFQCLYGILESNRVTIKSLDIMIVCCKHTYHMMEYINRGVSIIRDKYIQSQIFYLKHQVYFSTSKAKIAKQSIRKLINILFGNTIRFQLSD